MIQNTNICMDVKIKTSAKKRTHLFFNNKSLKTISGSLDFTRLSVLYLQDNDIERIENLSHAQNLRSLYLQNNKIKNIENLNLRKLKKLYLGRNLISEVKNLEGVPNLEELHLEKQIIFTASDSEISLLFSNNCFSSLKHLRMLVVCGNSLSSLASLEPLEQLRALRATHNKLHDFTDLVNALQSWPQLQDLKLTGNILCSDLRYREKIITASNDHLEILDDKPIMPITRSFLQNLSQRRASHRLQPGSARRATIELYGNENNTSNGIDDKESFDQLESSPEEQDRKPHNLTTAAEASNQDLNTIEPTQLKSCSSAGTDLSHHIHISKI